MTTLAVHLHDDDPAPVAASSADAHWISLGCGALHVHSLKQADALLAAVRKLRKEMHEEACAEARRQRQALNTAIAAGDNGMPRDTQPAPAPSEAAPEPGSPDPIFQPCTRQEEHDMAPLEDGALPRWECAVPAHWPRYILPAESGAITFARSQVRCEGTVPRSTVATLLTVIDRLTAIVASEPVPASAHLSSVAATARADLDAYGDAVRRQRNEECDGIAAQAAVRRASAALAASTQTLLAVIEQAPAGATCP